MGENYENVDPRRFARELFEGADITVGRELVNLLKSEGVGIQVRSRGDNNRKMKIIVDREAGEEDFTFRQVDESENKLLGIVFPTGRKDNEFVFVSGDEEGFVFDAGKRRMNDFDSSVSIMQLGNWDRFTDYVSMVSASDSDYRITKTLREGKNSDQFAEIAYNAITKERQRVIDTKTKMADVRKGLFKKLFGGE